MKRVLALIGTGLGVAGVLLGMVAVMIAFSSWLLGVLLLAAVYCSVRSVIYLLEN